MLRCTDFNLQLYPLVRKITSIRGLRKIGETWIIAGTTTFVDGPQTGHRGGECVCRFQYFYSLNRNNCHAVRVAHHHGNVG